MDSFDKFDGVDDSLVSRVVRKWSPYQLFFQNCILHYSGARSARSESQYLSKMVVITISHLAEKIWFIMEFSIPKTSRKTVVLW